MPFRSSIPGEGIGLMPIGDTPRGVGWWYHRDIEAKHRWFGLPWGGQGSHLSWPLYVENLHRRLAEINDLANDPNADLVESLGKTRTREQQVPIIDALVNNNEGQFQVNVPNNGTLSGLPDDLVVEVPAIINQKGVQPYVAGSIPPKVMLNQVFIREKSVFWHPSDSQSNKENYINGKC